MSLPIDLILVRHGESESNYANHLDRAGRGDEVDQDHWVRHTSEYPLTPRGIEQAKAAGEWLRGQFKGFDFCICSGYVRAQETAAYLNLPGEGWVIDPYLVERSSGALENLRESERIERYGEDYVQRMVDHFYARPPNGESRMEAGLRWDRMMLSLSQRHANDRTVVVTHGTIMESGMIRRLHWTIDEFYTWKKANNPETRIHNCQIVHFTRRDPLTDRILPSVRWWRTICPWDQSQTKDIWREIKPRRFTSKDLLERVAQYPRLVRE